MLSVNLPEPLELHLNAIVQESYHGDMQAALADFLLLHEKYGWKEQLRRDVKSIRAEVHRQGGITEKAIEQAVKKYRKPSGASRA